jgi:callose synthase
MGILQTLPLAVTLTVEKGFRKAISEIGFMILSGGPLYFIFHIQTKSYYFSQTLLAGGAMYRPTGRGFVTQHAPFDDNFRFFASSHIYLGFELAVALVLFAIYTKSTQYPGLTWSLWLAAVSFLMGPFWFNPLSFEWSRISEDYYAWLCWMAEHGGSSEQSWDVWWREENSFYPKLSSSWKIALIIQKCVLWMFIAAGLAGNRLYHSSKERFLVVEMLSVIAVYVFIKWVLHKVERHQTYAVRRFISLFLSASVGITLIYLFSKHSKYVLYSVAAYYFCAAVAFLMLLIGQHSVVMHIYKLHDYVVGHAIFFLLSIACVLQVSSSRSSAL